MDEAKVSHLCLLNSSFLSLNNERPCMGFPSWGLASLRFGSLVACETLCRIISLGLKCFSFTSDYSTSSSSPDTRPSFGLHRLWPRVNNLELACGHHRYFVRHNLPFWGLTLQLPWELLLRFQKPSWRVSHQLVSSPSFCKPTTLLGARQAMPLLPPQVGFWSVWAKSDLWLLSGHLPVDV